MLPRKKSRRIVILVIFLLIALMLSPACASERTVIELGLWDKTKIDLLIRQGNEIETAGDRIALISRAFLQTAYRAGTLTGCADTPESLVIRLDGVDCFTLLDYVEALRRADSYSDFKAQLIKVRYRGGHIGYLTRNHFFTDWLEEHSDTMIDATSQIGAGETIRVEKKLNLKADGGLYLPGYPIVRRSISYVPSTFMAEDTLRRLRTGDYIGFYSSAAGLDVSHAGIVIKTPTTVLLRHASSMPEKQAVVDVELLPYLRKTSGFIVLRPL